MSKDTRLLHAYGGVALAAHGVGEIDRTDISPEMLDQAAQKGSTAGFSRG
ncbi:MAG: hypothetical protein WD078_06545 [Woeseia sp.]